MMEVIIVALKVLIVIGGGVGLFYLAKQIPWPAPVGTWAMLLIGVILLILVVWLMLTWGFGVAIPT